MKKEENNNLKNSNKIKSGISLIVLVITIIVIIILAAAVIITLTNNNPISESNKARYESDRDNMQSIFSNTVAKVMAVKQSSIKIQPGTLNSVKSGVSSTTGVANYTLEGIEDSSKASGTIEFDNKENEENKYYTGKKLPIYKAGETIWSVDEEGILKLSVGGNEYNNSGENDTTTGDSTSKEENVTISKEEYESLKASVEDMKAKQDVMESAQKAMENEQTSLKTALTQVVNKLNSNEIRTGDIIAGSINAYATKIVNVNFSTPMKNANYRVTVTHSSLPSYWPYVEFSVTNKTVNGFRIDLHNTDPNNSGNIILDYIAVSNSVNDVKY